MHILKNYYYYYYYYYMYYKAKINKQSKTRYIIINVYANIHIIYDLLNDCFSRKIYF